MNKIIEEALNYINHRNDLDENLKRDGSNIITVQTHSRAAAERLKRKLDNKFYDSPHQFTVVNGNEVEIPNRSAIVRYVSNQPEVIEEAFSYINHARQLDEESISNIVKKHINAYSIADDPYDVAVSIGKHYKWSQKQIEAAEKIISKKYIR